MSQSHAGSDDGKARLATGSITRHLIAQTLPMIVGVAAIMSVGIVDAYFVGQLGARELAAVSFIFPITTALSSLGVGVIAGISSVVSREIGAGDMDAARRLGSLGITLSLLFGVVAGVLLFVLRSPLFRLLQADAELLPLIEAYMLPFALAFPVLLWLMGISGALRGQGAAKRAAAILLTFSLANWVLDPILIQGAFGFEGFGVAGAAYATIGGWVLGGILAFVLLQTSQIRYHPRHLGQTDWKGGAKALGRISGPAAFSNAINPTGLAVLTALLAREGNAAVAGFGAGGRVESFAVVPLLGLSSSIGAIVGQNWGAGHYDRVRKALMRSGGFCLAYGLAVALLLVVLRGSLGALFSDDAEVKRQLASYLAIAVWGYWAYGIQIVVNGALNAVDHAQIALMQSIARMLLVMVPVAWVLRGAWGAPGVYAGELAANLFGGLVAIGVAYWVFWRKANAALSA